MRRVRWFFCGIVLGACASGAILLSIAYVSAPRWYRILFIGSDQRGSERARSDVMVVLNIPSDSDEKPVLLSIPRDTLVQDNEYGLQKMTHFYAFGDRRDDGKILGNVDLTQHHIEELLNIRIDATVEVTFQSFVDIVNTLGGTCVEADCETAGNEALKVIRDRFSEGRSDFSRQENEREVIGALISRLHSRVAIEKIGKIFDSSHSARLQYNPMQLIYFGLRYVIAHRGTTFPAEYESLSVPGSSDMVFTESFGKKLYYWVPDTEKLSEIIENVTQ